MSEICLEIEKKYKGVRQKLKDCVIKGEPLKIELAQFDRQNVLTDIMSQLVDDQPMKCSDMMCVITDATIYEHSIFYKNWVGDNTENDMMVAVVAPAPFLAFLLGDYDLAKAWYQKYGREPDETAILLHYSEDELYLPEDQIVLEVVWWLLKQVQPMDEFFDELCAKDGGIKRFEENVGDFCIYWDTKLKSRWDVILDLIRRKKNGENITRLLPFAAIYVEKRIQEDKKTWDCFYDVLQDFAMENADEKEVFEKGYIDSMERLISQNYEGDVEKRILEYLNVLKPENYSVNDFVKMLLKHQFIKWSCIYMIWYKRFMLNKKELILDMNVKDEKAFIEEFFNGKWITEEEEKTEELKARFEMMLDVVTFIRDEKTKELPKEIQRILDFDDIHLIVKAIKCVLITADYRKACIEYCFENELSKSVPYLLVDKNWDMESVDDFEKIWTPKNFEGKTTSEMASLAENMLETLSYLDESGYIVERVLQLVNQNLMLVRELNEKKSRCYRHLCEKYCRRINPAPLVEI